MLFTMGVHPPKDKVYLFLYILYIVTYFAQCCTVYEGIAQARPNEGLARKGLHVEFSADPSKRLKNAEIAFIPVGDYIFLPTNEVL